MASKAQLLASQGRLDEALKIVKAYLLRNPDAGRAWRTLAGLHFLHGDLEEAVDAGAKCLALTPEDQEAWTNQATYLMALNRAEEALAACDGCLALGPHPRALANRKDILASLGRSEAEVAPPPKPKADAKTVAGGDAKTVPQNQEKGSLTDGKASAEDPSIHLAKVKTLLADKKVKEGEQAIREAAQKFKTNPDVLRQLAELAGSAGIDLIHQLCDQALKQDPKHADSWLTKAKAHRAKGELDKALECVGKGIALTDGATSQAYKLQGDTLLALGRADEALESYDQTVKLDPKDWYAWANRGEALVKLRQLGEAVASYDKALEIKPDDSTLQKNRDAVVKRKRNFEAKTVVRTEPPIAVKPAESVAERQAKSLVTKAVEVGPEKGRSIADQIKELAGYDTSETIQGCHAEALIKLSAKATDFESLRGLLESLTSLEIYHKNLDISQQHREAIITAIAEEAPVHNLRKMASAFKLLPEYGQSNEIQRAHAKALSTASGKAGPFASKLADSIAAIPHYAKDETIQFERAQALARAAAHASAGQIAVKTAQSVATLSFYQDSERIREAHAEALHNAVVSTGKASVADELANEIAEIPGFAESEPMQKFCAQALASGCEAAQKSKAQVNAFRDRILELPLYPRSSALQLIHKGTDSYVEETEPEPVASAENKAVELPKPEAPRQKGIPKAVATALVALAVGFLFLFIGKEVYHQVTLNDRPEGPTSTKNEPFEDQLALAQKAFDSKEYELAEGYARTAVDLARAGEKETLLPRAYLLLARIEAAGEDWDKLAALTDKLSKEQMSELANEFMAGELDPKSARAIEILAQKLDNKEELLAKVVEVYQESHPLEAARILEANGDLERAFKLTKKAGDVERQLELLKKLVEKDPKYKSELTAVVTENARGLVAQAEKAFAEDQAKDAESLAKSTLSVLEGVDSAKSIQSRARTVLAKLAYLDGDYREAVNQAQEAHRLAPSADTQQRLKDYKATDAQTITREELDAAKFKFVQPQKGDVTQTFLYYITSKGCPAGRGVERQFLPDQVDVKARPQHIEFLGKLPTGRVIATLTFDISYTNKKFAPGLLESVKGQSPIALDIGSKKCHRVGQVQIHEVEWRNDKLASFSADFFIACDSTPDRPTYGKIRYRSKIK